MKDSQKNSIIEAGKDFFRYTIIPNHLSGLKKLKLKDFVVNPFLIHYLAAFLCGDTTPEGVRDLYIIKKIYVGEKDNGNKMGNTKDYRLMFDIQFSMQLFENYKKHNLKMMRTYSVSSMESLIR